MWRRSQVKGYRQCVLTPNRMEFQRLCAALQATGLCPADAELTLEEVVAALDGPIVIEKGPVDRIAGFLPPETTDGSWGPTILECAVQGAPRRPGGLGDFLAGSLGTMLAWYLGSGLISLLFFGAKLVSSWLRVSRSFPCATWPTADTAATRQGVRSVGLLVCASTVTHRPCICDAEPCLQGDGRDQTKGCRGRFGCAGRRADSDDDADARLRRVMHTGPRRLPDGLRREQACDGGPGRARPPSRGARADLPGSQALRNACVAMLSQGTRRGDNLGYLPAWCPCDSVILHDMVPPSHGWPPASLTKHQKHHLMDDSYERAGTIGFRCVYDVAV